MTAVTVCRGEEIEELRISIVYLKTKRAYLGFPVHPVQLFDCCYTASSRHSTVLLLNKTPQSNG